MVVPANFQQLVRYTTLQSIMFAPVHPDPGAEPQLTTACGVSLQQPVITLLSVPLGLSLQQLVRYPVLLGTMHAPAHRVLVLSLIL